MLSWECFCYYKEEGEKGIKHKISADSASLCIYILFGDATFLMCVLVKCLVFYVVDSYVCCFVFFCFLPTLKYQK